MQRLFANARVISSVKQSVPLRAIMARAFATKNFVEMSEAAEWDQFIESTEPIVLQAGATWCGPCNFLKPRMLSVGEEFEESVKFVFMDIDKFPEIAEMLEIQHIPKTFMIYKGEVVDTFGGVPQEDEKIRQFFKRASEKASE